MSDDDWLAKQGWGPADLEANAAGKLSGGQLAVLRARNRSYLWRALVYGLALPVASLVFAIVATVAWNMAALFVLPVMGFLTVSILLVFVIGRVRAVHGDLEDGTVAQVSGTIERWFVNTTTGQATLRIGDDKLESWGPGSDPRWKEVRRCLLDARKHHQRVRAYFLPGSRLVIAAEAIRSSE